MSDQENSQEQLDLVRPGEQWFFYWKTSAALWEGRIRQFPSHEIIFLPLNWGFHAEAREGWDFGRLHPERDLLRLTQLLTQHGRKFCFLLPLTPAPFLPNGGVPASVARTLSVAKSGVHLAILDHEKKLNKMFSFFDPKVFHAFSSFVSSLKGFLTQANIQVPIWGAHFYYHEGQSSLSYLEDFSLAFEQGFSRFLKQNHDQRELVLSEEHKLKSNFTHEVQKLFLSVAQEKLANHWVAVQPIVVLGGSPKDTIERSLPSGKSQAQYFKELFHHYLGNQWISSCLLNEYEKDELLKSVLDEHFGHEEIIQRYQYQIYSGDLGPEYRPFSLVDIFDDSGPEHFFDLGLLTFLDKHYRWAYQRHLELIFTPEWIEVNQHKVKFFHGRGMDRLRFGQMLKLFLMGQKIVLDKTGLDPELEKRLQVFYLENNLKFQSVNYLTTIILCELGEGRFITFEGDKLISNPEKEKFWGHLFQYFNLTQPELVMDQEVFSLWRIRATSPYELNYIDVRRVNFYNPTSYKKQVTIHTQKHFAFLKVIDPVKAKAKSTTDGVDIELLPQGKIALDFGHYEEN